MQDKVAAGKYDGRAFGQGFLLQRWLPNSVHGWGWKGTKQVGGADWQGMEEEMRGKS